MALVVKDRVKETTTTTGTGTYTLGGAVTGFETFTSNLSNADTTYYVCTDGTDFEVGIGTFTSSGTTLARTTILASSNSNNAVSWSSGTREIFITYPADKAVFKDASNNINGTFVGNITGNVTGNADTATVATTVTITDNESTSEDNAVVFTAGGDVDGGNLGLESDGDLTYNPSTGRLTATQLAGTLQTAAQTNITSVGTLSSLTTSGDITVGDDLTVNGGVIDLKTNSGSVAQLKFYCESGNAHAQTLQAQPHSASASDVLTLPTGGNSTLVSRISTDTLTNKSIDSDNNTITNIVNADIKSSAAIANSKLANSSITVADGSSSTAVALGGTITFAGTSNEVEVGESSGTITVGLPDDVTITGNLTVNGTTTTIDTTNTLVKDSLLGLNNGASSNSNDSGIIVERGSTGNDALLIWDESADKWALGTTTDNASSTGNLNMTTGTLVANIEGNVTGNVTGNTSGTAATVTSAAQTNITSLGTLTGLTVDGDVTLTGANYNVTWDKSDNALEFPDNAKATFGDNAELQIYNNGTNSLIEDAGAGVINMKTNGTLIKMSGGSDSMAIFRKDGAVELYHDNSQKFETTSAGVTVTGVVTADGFTIGSAVIAEAELEILDGATVTTAELNILDGVTATASELNIMDGVTATTAELNYSDGVTSAIQTQLDAKATKGFATAMAIAL